MSLVPVPVGGILIMYNTSNPAEIYNGTTWELLPDNKFLKTGSTPLQQSGSNSINIVKANLPNVKLKVDTVSTNITGIVGIYKGKSGSVTGSPSKSIPGHTDGNIVIQNQGEIVSGSTGSISPNTEVLGNGAPISINPEHITVKAWKRLT